MRQYDIHADIENTETLLALLREAGAPVRADCGGAGRCGKCRVIADGAEILACRYLPRQDVTVFLPEEEPEKAAAAAETAPAEGPYTLCADVGTTVVAASLLAGNGERIAEAARPNGQRAWGADVMSRIGAAAAGDAPALTERIRGDVARLWEDLLTRAGLDPQTPADTVLCGNTAMLGLYAGRDVTGLARAPYHAETSLLRTAEGETLMPGIGPFTGADLLGGIAMADLDRRETSALFLDVGTNGEIALAAGEKLFVTSVAAGPALEGGNISCGMMASDSAIAKVELCGPYCTCHMLGNADPEGLCGSGVISVVSELVRGKMVDSTGLLIEDCFDEGYPLAPGLNFTQEDVRNVQKAKAAIRAGADLLLEKAGIDPEAVETVFLAGGFGAHLDPEEVCRIGLVDPLYQDRIVQPGNTSLLAAEAFARGTLTEERLSEIRERITEVYAAEEAAFAAAYIRRMDF